MGAGFLPDRIDRMARAMRAHVDRGELTGGVTWLSRGGETIVHPFGTMDVAGEKPMEEDALFRIASLTKPIVGVAARVLVEEGKLRLEDSVESLLPELAGRRVLRALDAEVGDTVPAKRAITVDDVVTFRLGYGAVMQPPGSVPYQRAMEAAAIAPGPWLVKVTPDEFLRRLAALPLLHQPGEAWSYHTAADVLGVLLERATGERLGDILRTRIFEPLGREDTGFVVPSGEAPRLAEVTGFDRATRELVAYPDPRDDWSAPAIFESGGAGLVSTVDDLGAFLAMLLRGGALDGRRVLSEEGVREVTRDHLTREQKDASPFYPGFWDSRGWGYATSVITGKKGVWWAPGSFGWDGGTGTTAYVDPANDLVAILFTQRQLESPIPSPLFCDFWDHVYRALERG